MTKADYSAWLDRYAVPLGLTRDDDALMLDSWFEVFSAAGYTAAELEHARMVILQSPPRFRTDHLNTIHETVRRLRTASDRRAVAAESQAGELGECVDCGNSGMVVVPHPKIVAAGKWAGETAAVCCHCFFGKRARTAYDKLPATYLERSPGPPMEWVQYNRQVPGWRDLIADHEAKLAQFRKARVVTEHADRGGPIAGTLAKVLGGLTSATP